MSASRRARAPRRAERRGLPAVGRGDAVPRRFSARVRLTASAVFALVGLFLLVGLIRSFGSGDVQVMLFSAVALAIFGQVGYVVLRVLWAPQAQPAAAA